MLSSGRRKISFWSNFGRKNCRAIS